MLKYLANSEPPGPFLNFLLLLLYVSQATGLKCLLVAITGSDTKHPRDGGYENLAIANLSRSSCLGNRFHDPIGVLIGHAHIELYLRYKSHTHLRAAISLGMPRLF